MRYENIAESKIREAFKSQEGEINQMPPVYSALKVNGQKMCDLARKGKADSIDIKPRKVNIKKIEILNISNNKITFYVKCSKGTYVRSICHDIGEYLNCGGHMSFLLRTSSGKFNLDNAITLEELEDLKNNGHLEDHL
ncbi:MAG: tRNA pseudouridine(55) synthase TruB, partial [Intestinibacter sp.]